MPQTFEDVVESLVPELRRRGLFWNDYSVPGGTYRENLNEAPGQKEPLSNHPAGKLIWRPPGADTPQIALNGNLTSSMPTQQDDEMPAWVLDGLR